MGSIDAAIENVFGPIATVLSTVVFYEVPIWGGIPIIVVWLMAAAMFLTVWLRFQPITGFKHSLQVIRGRYTRKTDPGEVSSFQALATELSGTVGLGNIAGVAVAIVAGGPGAALWIAIFGFFGMSVKMAEATLGVMYRRVKPDGSTEGGPQYFLRDGLAAIGFKRTGKVLALMYAIFALVGVFGAGNLFQANQVSVIVSNATGNEFLTGNQWIIGVIMAVLAAVVFLGGVKSIANATSAITPLMAILYFLCTLVIILVNIQELPAAISTIITGAFTAQGVEGGIIGVAVVGIQRALFSNAAGVGSAAMAHSASKTREPATEGFTAMWEPLVDSIIICMLTAIAITVTGVYEAGGEDGVALTSAAFGTVADWFPVLLTIAVALFGFSTVLAYEYYGELQAQFLFGSSATVRTVFRIVWVAAIVIGAAASLDSVVAFSDAMFFLMAIPNLLGIYFLSKVLRLEILRHRVRTTTGSIPVVTDPDLQAGLRDHEPTPEQVQAAAEEDAAERERLDDLHRRLGADPEWAHHDEHGRPTAEGEAGDEYTSGSGSIDTTTTDDTPGSSRH